MFRPLRRMASEPEGKVLLVSAASVLAFGTIAYSVLEGWSLIDSLYFSIVTLATVGFGDLTPTTDLAKLLTVGYIITGVGIIAAFASELTKERRASLLPPRETTSASDPGSEGGSVAEGSSQGRTPDHEA